MAKNKERFKVILKDLKTGDVDHYFVHELGLQMSSKTGPRGPIVVKMVMDYPRIKIKKRAQREG